jgi:hypothetical protein
VFKTENAIRAIHANKERLFERVAYQPGVSIPTAKGWCVPIQWIDDVRALPCKSWPQWEGFCKELSTSDKGARAVDIVLALIERGRFPFWVKTSESKDRDIQISGTDIVVDMKTNIQVKCDFDCGPKDIQGCTGNVYLQTAEINPLGLF